jgi:quercetin dioxygenase-like cupin family protein
MVAPDDVSWSDCPPAIPAGAKCAVIDGDLTAPDELFAFRVRFPDGFQIPAHFHPADEHLVVLAGTFHMGFGDKLDTTATRGMPAGSYMVMPEGKHHYAWAKGDTILQVYAIGPWGITYVNPADDPRNQKAGGK